MSGDNLVSVDAPALASEADAIPLPAEATTQVAGEGAPAPGVPGVPGEPTLEELDLAARNYEGTTAIAVNGLADVLAPNWQISGEQRGSLAHVSAMALAAWFPDHRLPIKYAVLTMVGASLFDIANANRDPETGRLRPLRLKPAARPAASSSDRPSELPATGARPGGFSTSA